MGSSKKLVSIIIAMVITLVASLASPVAAQETVAGESVVSVPDVGTPDVTAPDVTTPTDPNSEDPQPVDPSPDTKPANEEKPSEPSSGDTPSDPGLLDDGAEPDPGDAGKVPADEIPDAFKDGFDPYSRPGLDDPINGTPVPLRPIVEGPAAAPAIDVAKAIEEGNPIPAVDVKPVPIKPSVASVNGPNVKVEGTPFLSLDVPGIDQKSDAKVSIRPIADDLTTSLSSLGIAFQLDISGFGTRPRPIPEKKEPSDKLERPKDIDSIVADLGEASGWKFRIDAKNLDGLSNDQIDRLAVYVHSGCNKAGKCRITEKLPSHRDPETGELVADLGHEVLLAVGGPSRIEKVQVGGGRFFAGAHIPNPLGFAYSATSVYFSVSTTTGGAQGSYSASDLGSLATWQVGTQTGHAETSYSITAPPALGPMPSLGLSYSSGTVDGMNTSDNNQGGMIGIGWSMGTPVITRNTRTCASSAGNTNIDNNGWFQGNQCLETPNDETSGFTLTMNGVGGALVSAGVTGNHPTVAGATWELFETSNANDMRILLVTQSSMVGSPTWTGDAYGQWWEVTTSDGTLYVFGRDYIFKPVAGQSGPVLARDRVVDQTRRTHSAKVVPVANSNESGPGCSGQLCDTTVAWYLDQAIDPDGNMMTWQYWKETNHYKAKIGSNYQIRAYTRMVKPILVDYGLTYGEALKWYWETTDYRVEFVYSWRTANGASPSSSNPLIATPTDLGCAAAGPCAHTSPSFYNTHRISSINTSVGGGAVSRDVLSILFVGPSNSPMPNDGSKTKMWLQAAEHKNGAGTYGVPAVRFVSDPQDYMANRVNHPNGVASMTMPRIGRILTEMGGTVDFTYGQPYPPVPGGSSSNPCSAGTVPTNGYVRLPCDMFVAYDAFTGSGGAVLWNKYVVTKVRETPNTGQGSDFTELTYTYDTAPDWAYAEQKGFRATDLGQPGHRNCQYGYGCNYWNDYRGHQRVSVTDRSGAKTIHYYYTGMREDRFSATNVAPLYQAQPSNPAVTVTDPFGITPRDNNKWRRGDYLGYLQAGNNGKVTFRERSLNTKDWAVNPATEFPGSIRIRTTQTYSYIYDHYHPSNNFAEGSRTTVFFDAYTRPYRIVDDGLVHSSSGAPTGVGTITTCKIYSSASFTTAVNGSWVIGLPWTTATAAGNHLCSTYPPPSEWISGTTVLYGGQSGFWSLPTYSWVSKEYEFIKRNPAVSQQYHITEFTHNSRGQVLTAHDLDTNSTTTNTYDPTYGWLKSVDGPLPGTADKTSFVVEPKWGVQTSITAPNNQVTNLTYDSLGRLKTVTLPGAPKPSYKFSYNIINNAVNPSVIATEVLRQNGAGASEYIKSYSFVDGFGREIQSQTNFPDIGYSVMAVRNYGPTGQLKAVHKPIWLGQAAGTYWLYLNMINKDRTRTTYDSFGKATTTVYDTSNTLRSISSIETYGLNTKSVDPNGKVTLSVSDIRGNTVKVTDPNGGVTRYEYNLRNQVTKIIDPGGAQIVTSYANWQTSPTQMIDPDLGTITYGYDSAGRLRTQTDGNGNQIWVGYNIASQPTSIRQTNSGGAVISSFSYDASGRPTGTVHNNVMPNGTSNGTVTQAFTYDSRSRLASTTWNIPGIDPQTISQTYRESGGVDTVTYPDGTVSDYGFDSLERHNRYTYDNETLGHYVAYTARGQLAGYRTGAIVQTGAAVTDTSYTYQGWSGRILSKTVQTPTSQTLAAYSYQWDTAGNLASVHDTTPGVNQYQCFTYDNLYRLTSGFTTTASCTSGGNASGPNPYSVSYTYNPNGNINTANGTGTVNSAYGYGAGNAGPHAVTAAGGNTYSYDNAGNQTGRTISGQTTTLGYDIQNRLVEMSGAGADLDALYDASGSRVKRTLDGSTTYYIGGNYEIADTPGGGASPADDFNRPDTASGYGPSWSLHSPYSGGTVTTGRITSHQAVIDASWTMAVHSVVAGSDDHYAQAVVDVDASNNWVGPAVRLNASGNQGYAVLARGGVNELRLYRVNSSLGSPVVAIGAGTAVDGKTVKIEATGAVIKVYLDGVLKITWTDPSPFVGAGNRGVGALGHNGMFDDFVASDPPGAGASTTVVRVHHSMAGQTLGSTVDGVFVVSVTDHLGSGSLSRDELGVTTVQGYTPFGAIRGGGGNVLPTDLTFTGQTDDPGTGLVDYNARAYDPVLGRFVMADTVLDGTNRYTYVRNNPTGFVDPSGHCVSDLSFNEDGSYTVTPMAGHPECDPEFGPADTDPERVRYGQPFTRGGSQPDFVYMLRSSSQTQNFIDSSDWDLLGCDQLWGGEWTGERISCFREKSKAPLPVPECYGDLACTLASAVVLVVGGFLVGVACTVGEAATPVPCLLTIGGVGGAMSVVEYVTLSEEDNPETILCVAVTGGAVSVASGGASQVTSSTLNKGGKLLKRGKGSIVGVVCDG